MLKKFSTKDLPACCELYVKVFNITAITLLTAVGNPAFDFYEKQGYRHLDYMALMHKRVT